MKIIIFFVTFLLSINVAKADISPVYANFMSNPLSRFPQEFDLLPMGDYLQFMHYVQEENSSKTTEVCLTGVIYPKCIFKTKTN